MNEQLTRLYRASRPKEALASQDEYKSANALLGSDVDKFAELLIRECSKIAQQYDGNKLGGPGTVIAARIETHFGVEE